MFAVRRNQQTMIELARGYALRLEAIFDEEIISTYAFVKLRNVDELREGEKMIVTPDKCSTLTLYELIGILQDSIAHGFFSKKAREGKEQTISTQLCFAIGRGSDKFSHCHGTEIAVYRVLNGKVDIAFTEIYIEN